MFFGDFFDGVGVDVGNIATNKGLDVFGDNKLFHNDGASFVAKRIVTSWNWII